MWLADWRASISFSAASCWGFAGNAMKIAKQAPGSSVLLRKNLVTAIDLDAGFSTIRLN
jgi:hypothetical protein